MTFPELPLQMGNPGDTPSHRRGQRGAAPPGGKFLGGSSNSFTVRFHQPPVLSSAGRILGSSRGGNWMKKDPSCAFCCLSFDLGKASKSIAQEVMSVWKGVCVRVCVCTGEGRGQQGLGSF